ncbi:uncharacterized protein PHACADRAFT_256020 [Phanerochaete carnosa HHB-10118-sp]|uniref:Cleavage/polyadenylation specificity factor A subunit N-terminal domain-containing protein n=1 Tax=Phanerochaete carnosa (strain HHB-10118-sp) TaxID=650164 RepID=K5W8X0_PHACS|nr:uncharacterized protein PHACADRAFT_256020 [Phanerochaete carnosa HHB-10118-sp]EKM55409.1 hypothetical protein PHACADRAFT_256020 [Phanerochaete carnosa HHB-10118-sp]
MALREDICVVARSNILSIYSLASGEPALVQDLHFDHALGNVAFAAEAAPEVVQDKNTARLQLLITSHSGLHVYSVSQDESGAFVSRLVAEEAVKQSTILTSSPQLPRFGGSASHVAWTNTPKSFFDRQSHVFVARVVATPAAPSADSADAGRDTAREATPAAQESKLEVLMECKDSRLPSLNAMPVMDFDDGVGIIAIGNALGELALCSYGVPLTPQFVDCLRPVPIPSARRWRAH